MPDSFSSVRKAVFEPVRSTQFHKESRSRRIPILTYHSIDDSGSVVSTSRSTFERQMTLLSNGGYRTITVSRLAGLIEGGQWPNEKVVVITFDDGFENFLTTAAPILQNHSFTATVYLVSDHCGHFNNWSGNPPELPRSRLLSWQQVKELSNLGIEFGSHTASHPDLTTLDAIAVESELMRSRLTIEDKLGKKVRTFAYPFGRTNATVDRFVRQAYGSACSTNLGKITDRSDLYALERVDSYYLSRPASLEMLDTRWMDTYLAIRHALRTMKAGVAGH